MTDHLDGQTITKRLTESERIALLDAAKRPGGWGLFKPKTTAKLAEQGFFVKEKHPVYGMQWRITDSGKVALNAQP